MTLGICWNELSEVQKEIHRWADEQFPDRTDFNALSKLVLHEIPELLVHKKEKGLEGIGTELADCFILLMDLASMWEVDVDQAIAEKMRINYTRQWNKDENGIMQHRTGFQVFIPHEELGPYISNHASPPTKCVYCGSSDTRLLTDVELEVIKANFPEDLSDTTRCRDCGSTFDDSIPF